MRPSNNLYQKCLFVFVIFSTFLIKNVVGQVILNDSEEEYFVTDYEILEDPSKSLTFKDIVSKDYVSSFKKNNKAVEINKNRSSAYWLKFKVKNLSSDSRGWLVEFYDFKIDKMKFYSPNSKGEYIGKQAGDNFPFKFKKFHHKNLEFLIPDNQGKETTYYVRIESQEYVAFVFVVRTYQKFVNYAVKEYYFLGLFYGIIIIIGLLNLFIFYTTRDKAHILYVYYVVSLGIFSMTMDGTAFQYLWPNAPFLNNYAAPVASLSTIIAALLYSKSFLETEDQLPIFNKIINGAIVVRLMILVYDLIFNLDNLWHPLLDWSTLILPYFAGMISWILGYNPAKYYVIAFTSVFIGYLIFTLANQGVIPANYFTIYAINFAVVIEVIFLSLALADRIKTFKKEKEIAQQEKISQLEKNEFLQQTVIDQLKENELLQDKVNRELEIKVQERTKDLMEAQEEIKRMNELLHIDNKKLESNVKTLHKARVMQKTVSFDEFQTIYPDDKACYEYLANLKWGGGFKCIQCQNIKFTAGNTPYSRRCTRCGYIESVTANTIFYRLKFPIIKAFYIVFLVSSKRNITSEDLSKTVSLRKQTCWTFKKKVLEEIASRTKKKNQNINWNQLVLSSGTQQVDSALPEETDTSNV